MPKANNLNLGESIQFLVPPEKVDDFWAVIVSHGYEESPKGVLDFILESDLASESEEPEEDTIERYGAFGAMAADWINKNPDKVKRAQKKASDITESLIAKLRKNKS